MTSCHVCIYYCLCTQCTCTYSQQQASKDSEINKGKAAYGALQLSFARLCDEVDPDVVVPDLFSKGFISGRAAEKARYKYVDRHGRVQDLLIDIMKAVERRPQLCHDLWKIFESARVPSIENLKGICIMCLCLCFCMQVWYAKTKKPWHIPVFTLL